MFSSSLSTVGRPGEADELQQKLEQEVLTPLKTNPQINNRSTRRIIVRPEDSEGKFLVPVEDLGLDLVPLENTETTPKTEETK